PTLFPTRRSSDLKALRADEGPLGGKKKDRRNEGSAFSEKRWTHTCRTKKALAVNEGSLGGATESCGTQVVDQYNRNPQLTDSLRFQIGCGVKLLARGLEPPRVSPYGPEPYASANSATRAKPVALTMRACQPPARSNRGHARDEPRHSEVSPHVSSVRELPIDVLCVPGQASAKGRHNWTRQSRNPSKVYPSPVPKS